MAPPAIEVSERDSRALAEQAITGQRENDLRFTEQTPSPYFRAQLEDLPSESDLTERLWHINAAGRYYEEVEQSYQKSLSNVGEERHDVDAAETSQECSTLPTEEANVNGGDLSSQNNSVMDSAPKATAAKLGGDLSCKIACSVATRKKAKNRVHDINLLPMSDLAKRKTNVHVEPCIMQQPLEAQREIQMTVEALNSAVMDFFISKTRLTRGLVFNGNYVDDGDVWKIGVNPCPTEKLLEDLFRRKKLISGFKWEPPPKVSCYFMGTAPQKSAPLYETSSPAVTSQSSVSQACTETQSAKYQQCLSDEQQQQKKQREPTHHVHSSTTASSAVPPGSNSTQPPSSRSKSNGNESASPSSHQSEGGRGSNQRGGIQAEEEDSDDVAHGGTSKKSSKSMNTSSQINKKEEAHVALEQQQHLSQELPHSTSSKIPPDKAVNEERPQVSSYRLSLTSPGGPGTDILSQTPPVLLCSEAAGQPKVKPHQNTPTTLENEGIAKDPPITIHDEASSQLWSSFNVKLPPDTQASHRAEISSGALSETEWNESTAKSSGSVNTLADTLRDYAPVVPLSNETPPSDDDELPMSKVAPEVINEDVTDNELIPIPDSEYLLGTSVLLTIEAVPFSAVSPPTVFDNHSLQLGFLEGKSVDEFSPLLFNSSAGDDVSPLSLQPSSQEEVAFSGDGDIYKRPVEEAGTPEPGNTEMVVSRPTCTALPADHMLENQPSPQAAASLLLLPYTIHGGRIISPFSDVWGFTAFIVPERSSNSLTDPVIGERLE